MPQFNILVGCDQTYYEDWAVELLKSIHRHTPWIRLHCHIVNSSSIQELDYVDYTYENRSFASNDSKVAYLQAVRFLQVSEKFTNNEKVLTLDADTICTREFTEEDIRNLFENNSTLRHPKSNDVLAGLVVFATDDFKHAFSRKLLEKEVDCWTYGRDQVILGLLSEEFGLSKVGADWITIGKNRNDSVFLTLKGDQKTTDKYRSKFDSYKDK